MADEPAPEVDPRFDPVFQRGYDPEVHARPVRRSVLRAPAMKPAPLPAAPPSAPTPAPAPAPAAAAPAVEPEEDDEPHRRNPWLLALVLVSVAFLVVAGAFLWAIGQRDIYSFSGQPTAADLMVQQLSYMLPPGLVTAGLLGLMLRVAIGAVRGRA